MLGKLANAWWFLKQIRWYSVYKIDPIRFILCKLRKWYFINIKKQITLWDGNDKHLRVLRSKSTINYNLTGLIDVSCARSTRLIKPLSVIETYRPLDEMPTKGGQLHDLDYQTNAKILSIGPRTEGELYCLRGYGFKKENIHALDLISYSPMIQVGDMHNMPYEDNSFDIVMASCVLVYSLTPEEAIKEIIRVAKPGGLICIGQDMDFSSDNAEYIYKSCSDYLDAFAPYVDRVFYQHELPENNRDTSVHTTYTCALIFQLVAEKAQQSTLSSAA